MKHFTTQKLLGACLLALSAMNTEAAIIRAGDTLPVNDPYTWDFYITEAYIGVTGNGTLRVDAGNKLSTRTTSIGYTATSAGHVAVAGRGLFDCSIWNNQSAIIVGDYGQGALEISNGGFVNSGTVWVGHMKGSTGLIAVDGEGSHLAVLDLDVGFCGDGALQISNGGDVTATGNSYCSIGGHTDGSGAVAVSGIGSTWGMVNGLNIGTFSPGSLSITLGGVVHTGGNVKIGAYNHNQAAASVGGTSSIWGIGGDLYIAAGSIYCASELNIYLGGVITTGGEVSIGKKGTGTVNVGGAESRWVAGKQEGPSLFYIGQHGNGRLNITAGGSVDNSAEQFYTVLGYDVGSGGIVTVDGMGSIWKNHFLSIGNKGVGMLTISDGGAVVTERGGVGKGIATVDGSGSNWQLYELQVGDRLNISNGGLVNAFVGSINGDGQVSVDGTGSTLNTDNRLYIGDTSGGSMHLMNGGTVTTGPNGYIARQEGSTGTVLVKGTNSSWILSNDLNVANAGTGSLTIDGGLCAAQRLLIAQSGGLGSVDLIAGGRLLLPDPTWAEGHGAAEFLNLVEGSDAIFCNFIREYDLNGIHYIEHDRTPLLDATAGLDYHLVHFDSGVWAGYTMLFVPLDVDRDGIDDNWEQTVFGNLSTANASSDFDDGGKTDITEYLEGSNAKETPYTAIFYAGSHGTLVGANPEGNVVLPRDHGALLSAPVVSNNTNWVFTGWSPAMPSIVTGDFMTTAQYEVDTDNDGIGDSSDPDADGDGLLDQWERLYFGDLSSNGDGNPDNDAYTTEQEYILDFNPIISNGLFCITAIDGATIEFNSSSNRHYRLYSSPSLVTGQWSFVESKLGAGGQDSMSVSNNIPQKFYKLKVELP